MKQPVIVMGMSRSGTTLIAEMVHKGGTPMFSGDLDPEYDGGIKYERPLCQTINRQILGLEGSSRKASTIRELWNLPLQPISSSLQEQLAAEVSENAWGFKDPRTTLTYPMWCQIFDKSPRIYVYRSHQEVGRYYFYNSRSFSSSMKQMRRAVRAWTKYNERLLENLAADKAAGRPAALVRYEEMMSDDSNLLDKLGETVGVPLYDARNLNLRRNKVKNRKDILLCTLASVGFAARVEAIYRKLEAARLRPDS